MCESGPLRVISEHMKGGDCWVSPLIHSSYCERVSCRRTPDDVQCVLSPGDNSEHVFDVCAQLSAGTPAKSHT